MKIQGGPNGICQQTCPLECFPGEMLCEDFDSEDCSMGQYCITMQSPGPNEAYCPTFCNLICGQDEVPCPTTYDDNGCEMPGMCVKSGEENSCPLSSYDNVGCPMYHEPVVCTEPEVFCPAGTFENVKSSKIANIMTSFLQFFLIA